MSEKLRDFSSETNEKHESFPSPERQEQIKSLEKKGERESSEQNEQLQKAREKVEQLAKPQERLHTKTEKENHTFSPGSRSRQKKLAFKQTMQHTQAKMKPAAKTFSKIIHQPVIEKASDIAAKTVFRPSLTLGAALGAFLGGSMFYGFARYYGFNLSGTEFLFCGLVGAMVGVIWEFGGYLAKRLITR